MARVLITTAYSSDSIVLLLTKFSIDRLFLLIDKKPDETQQKAVDDLKKTFEKVIEIKEKRVELFDIVAVAQDTANIIDALANTDEIFVNVTHGRKTQALGALFGAYARSTRVKKIVYVADQTKPNEFKDIITLPTLNFDLSTGQQEILEEAEKHDIPADLAKETEQSKAMVYRNLKELKQRGFIEETEDGKGFKLTDAGKIARM
ncbi:MAG: CRISPR locus-related DNA-binding protein [Candidatus Diapherotrites archaeon]|nr:CRISPR locus-related DNA-binding protein [Candidatus Diapherotrites archaeon]